MSGKPRGCVGKPKQDPDWRAESTEGHLLPQSWVAAAVRGHRLKTVPFTNCYSKTTTTKEKTLEQKLLWPSLFLCSLRPGVRWIQKCPGNSNSSSLPVSLLFLSCALCMWRLKCCTHYACCCCCAWAKPANESQLKKRNRKRKYRCFLKMHRSSTEITKKNLGGSARSRYQQVSLRSDEVHKKKAYVDPPPAATRQLNPVYLIMSIV